jgi:uncharacterized protein YdeI (YjbR/CyaY-like superfamily)
MTMNPIFFKNQYEFRTWLERNHQSEHELWVGYYKVETGKSSMTWSQSVDQALCFGWIDGIRKKVDEESYCIRFTPRRKDSIWSKINIAKVEDLKLKGMMHQAGIEAFKQRRENKSGIYSFENGIKDLPEAYTSIFKQNKTAWEFYISQPPSYRRTIIHWVLSAKQESTRISRLEKLIAFSGEGTRIF